MTARTTFGGVYKRQGYMSTPFAEDVELTVRIH